VYLGELWGLLGWNFFYIDWCQINLVFLYFEKTLHQAFSVKRPNRYLLESFAVVSFADIASCILTIIYECVLVNSFVSTLWLIILRTVWSCLWAVLLMLSVSVLFFETLENLPLPLCLSLITACQAPDCTVPAQWRLVVLDTIIVLPYLLTYLLTSESVELWCYINLFCILLYSIWCIFGDSRMTTFSCLSWILFSV